VSRRLAAARRAGRGIYVGEWTFENLFNDELEAACEAGCEAIVAWCRETLGRCRRPWGIDYFDLALSAAPKGAPTSRSVRFRELRPGRLYDGELAERLACYLAETLQPAGTDANESPRRVTIAAGLFSWGDAAFAALPAAA
jgi:hypothetical protein